MKQSVFLEILRKGPHLEVSLAKGEQTLTHYEESSVTPEELKKRCNEMMHLLNMFSKKGSIPSSVIEEMQQMGRALFNEIFPLSIKTQLSDCKPSDLIIRVDNTLVHVPWELLFDGEYFLCEKFNIGRMVKTQQIVAPRGKEAPSLPLRILIIADPRGDLKASYEEGKRICEHLQKESIKVNLVTSEISRDYLKKRLFNYDIIHYAGHADYNIQNPKESGWLLEDGKFSSLDIRKMGGCDPLPWLVFSNACQSGQTEEWQIDESGEEKIYGLANAFLLSGVQHYIGTFCKVLDEPSTIFALIFYDHLLKGASVGEAMKAARLGLRDKYGEGNILWASYLLYGDPGIKYFLLRGTDIERDKDLAGVGANIYHDKKTHDTAIIRNGSLTRSPYGSNGLQGLSYHNNDDIRKRFSFFKKWKSRSLTLIIGIILAVFFVGGAILYRTLTDQAVLPENVLTNTPSKINPIRHLIKLGEASDDQIAEYFQILAKQYQKEGYKDQRDQWTSRPITLFLVNRTIDNDKTDITLHAETDVLLHKIMSILSQDPRITILEREYLETLLKELELGSSPLADPEHNLGLGQLLAANLFTSSSISHIEGKWQVNLRIIASETSIIKASLSEDWNESEGLDAIATKLAQKIIMAIEKSFPLKGRIRQYFSDNKVLLNIGYKHGVEKGMEFNVLKDIDILGDNGKPVASEAQTIALLVVTDVKDEFCYAEMKESTEKISSEMKVERVII